MASTHIYFLHSCDILSFCLLWSGDTIRENSPRTRGRPQYTQDSVGVGHHQPNFSQSPLAGGSASPVRLGGGGGWVGGLSSPVGRFALRGPVLSHLQTIHLLFVNKKLPSNIAWLNSSVIDLSCMYGSDGISYFWIIIRENHPLQEACESKIGLTWYVAGAAAMAAGAARPGAGAGAPEPAAASAVQSSASPPQSSCIKI